MTEEEANQVVEQLLVELAQRPVLSGGRTPQDGLVNAVQAEIAAGLPVQIKLKVKSEEAVDDPVAGIRTAEGSARGEFIQRRDYTSLEQLEILLDALRLAAVAPPLMASRLFSTLGELSKGGSVPAVNFANEAVPDQARAVKRDEVAPAVASSERLRASLDELLSKHEPVAGSAMKTPQ